MKRLLYYLRRSKVIRRLLGGPFRCIKRMLGLNSKTSYVSACIVSGTVRVRPNNIDGVFMMQAQSAIAQRIYATGMYEAKIGECIAHLDLNAGDIVNVGANVGIMALHCAHSYRARTVYAIEPNTEAFAFLKENITFNKCSRVVAINKLISSRPCRLRFSMAEQSEYSSIGDIVHPAAANSPVSSVILDAVPLSEALPRDVIVSLMLIDTEGAELLVLEGAENIIVRDRPHILLECYEPLLSKFAASPVQLLGWLWGHGYETFDAEYPSVRIRGAFDGEVLAVPRK